MILLCFKTINRLTEGIMTFKNISRRVLIVILSTFYVLITLFNVIVLFFCSLRFTDNRQQINHLDDLQEYYETTPSSEIAAEQSFVSFDIDFNDLRLNEIKMVASHNSYKKQGTALGRAMIALGSSKEDARLMNYGNVWISEQLDAGIRSIEIDLRYKNGSFVTTHVPLVDNRSVCPDFSLLLEELKLWSDNHPNHIPIIIILELKSDWMVLDPTLDDIGQSELEMLNDMLLFNFDSAIYTPEMLKGSYDSLQERIATESWPYVSDLLGKFIFVLHPGEFTDTYVSLFPDYEGMSLFPAVSNLDTDHGYAAFVVHNDPNIEEINALVAQNYIVRTRMDEDLVNDPDRMADAIASGAQILTTDLHPATQIQNATPIYLDGNYTVIVNDITHEDE